MFIYIYIYMCMMINICHISKHAHPIYSSGWGGGGGRKDTKSLNRICQAKLFRSGHTDILYRLDYNWLILLYMQYRNGSGAAEQATETDASLRFVTRLNAL